MATIIKRSEKGSALTNNEVDDNFDNINNDLIASASYATSTGVLTLTQVDAGTITTNVKPNIFSKVLAEQSNGTDIGTITADKFDDTITLRENGGISLGVTASSDLITIAHANTSSVANHSNNNSGGTVIQDLSLTFDIYGHVTAISSTDANLDNRYLQLTGGTMTGDITFSDDGEGVAWSRNTDGASIKFYNDSDSDTNCRLEFNTLDNGNEYFRWTTTNGSNTYTLADLKLNGTTGLLNVASIVNTQGAAMTIQNSYSGSVATDLNIIGNNAPADTIQARTGGEVKIQSGLGPMGSGTVGGDGGRIAIVAGSGGQYSGDGGDVIINSGAGGGAGGYASEIRLNGATDGGIGGSVSIKAGGSSGSNKAGADLYIDAGTGTGNADPGQVIIRTSPKKSSGSTSQTLENRVVIDETGIITGVWKASVIADEYGGTGQSSYAKGDILYASGTNVLSKLSAGTNGHYLRLVDGVPTWAVAVTEDANTTYSVSVPDSTTKIRLSGSDSTTDDIEIAGGSNVTVTRTNDSKLTISSTNTTYSTATSSTLGLVKIGYSENGKNYPVELSSGKMYVNVPWTDTDTNTNTTYSVSVPTSTTKIRLSGSDSSTDDIEIVGGSNVTVTRNDASKLTISSTNTTYSTATSSTLGLVKIGYTETGKNYPVELSSGKMYVNVPWTDTNTNTTYSAGTNLSLSGTTFNVAASPSFTDVYVADQIFHTGDTDTYTQFHAANQWRVVTGGAERLEVNDTNVTISNTLVESSDARLKENVRPIEDALSKVTSLQGVLYNKIETPELEEIGFIAQEVEEVVPEIVTTDETEEGMKAVSYARTVALLVEAIKELKAEVEELKAINNK
jgi:hypothetical protein